MTEYYLNETVVTFSGNIIQDSTINMLRLSDPDGMDRLLSLIDSLVRSTPCWLLGCNISVEAAEVSYRAMSGEKGELNGL